MARKPKSLDDRDLLRLDGFARQVEFALDQISDPASLGARSPLAAPYLLGSLLNPNAAGAPERGLVLRTLLLDAVAALEDEGQRHLAAACFIERNPHLTNAGVALRLGINERDFYRRRTRLIQSVADALYHRLLAPLQLEAPVRPPLVGRRAEAARMANTLRAGQSVYVAGASGHGKSTLAARVSSEWGRSAFWYTVRPGYNDTLENFLFALAYFLREHGAYRAWQQLIADRGAVKSEQVLGLLRYDLARFAPGALLCCIDDVDLLQAERADHARILHLLEELRPLVALLLIGQRTVLEADALVQLAPLSDAELDEWRAQLGGEIGLSSAHLRLLTRGVPVLLAALLLLSRSDPNAPATLLSTGEPISVESLFYRIWRRLHPDERTLLELLALFDDAAPADIWRIEASKSGAHTSRLLARLIERGLALEPAAGLVQVPLFLRASIVAQLPADRREMLHQEAAMRLEERGQSVPAMAHWIAGNQPAHAVWLWLRQRRNEINRGQAAHALALLDSIPTSQLPHANDRMALRVVLGELYLHAGRADEADALLRQHADATPPLVTAYLDELRADALRQLGEDYHSLAFLRSALDTLLDSSPLREVRVRGKLVHHFIFRQPDLDAARREALEGRIRAESFHGLVEEMHGNLTEARLRFETARRLAEEGSADPALLASTYTHLAQLLIVEGELDEAATLIERCNTLREQRGDTVQPLHDRINLAYAYSQAGSHEHAFALAQEGLPHARKMRNAYFTCGLATAAGEAALGLQRLDEAEALLIEAVAQEEEWFLHWALAVFASLRSAQGRHAEAQTLAQQALESASDTRNPYSEAYCLRIRGDVQAAAGLPDDARASYTQAHALFTGMGLTREAEALDARLAA